LGKNRKTLITREDVLKRSVSEYEALVAIAKEARRLNAVPGMHLKEGEQAIPKAVEHFVDGRVEYEVEGVRACGTEAVPPAPEAGVAAERKTRAKAKARRAARTRRARKAD
jgi:hypothetical protein